MRPKRAAALANSGNSARHGVHQPSEQRVRAENLGHRLRISIEVE